MHIRFEEFDMSGLRMQRYNRNEDGMILVV